MIAKRRLIILAKPMKLGSLEHKELFCRQFIDSHIHYEPEKLPWPDLDELSLSRLRSIPFWQQALMTEEGAGGMVSRFAETVEDPLMREAIALQGQEEERHGRLIRFLLNYYGIEIKEADSQFDEGERAFIDFGFEECLDSFFAFGMFGIAQKAQYMPSEMFAIFNPILDEEARHIVFFVNWITYRLMVQGQGLGAWRGLYTFWHYSKALWKLGEVFGGKNEAEETDELAFTAVGANRFMEDLTPELFLQTCLAENHQRMKQFHPQLLQPLLLPRLSRLSLNILKYFPQKTSANHADSLSDLSLNKGRNP